MRSILRGRNLDLQKASAVAKCDQQAFSLDHVLCLPALAMGLPVSPHLVDRGLLDLPHASLNF
jgi:hypothetical protein